MSLPGLWLWVSESGGGEGRVINDSLFFSNAPCLPGFTVDRTVAWNSGWIHMPQKDRVLAIVIPRYTQLEG